MTHVSVVRGALGHPLFPSIVAFCIRQDRDIRHGQHVSILAAPGARRLYHIAQMMRPNERTAAPQRTATHRHIDGTLPGRFLKSFDGARGVYRCRDDTLERSAVNKVSRVVMEYVGLVGIPIVGVLGALQAGSWLQAPAAPSTGVLRGAAASGDSSLPLLLFSVAVLVACARLAGVAARWLGQPQVVGEMAMGIALGPSLLGWLAPAVSHAVFPPGNHAHLNTLSQLGLLLFMFLVGLEFDLNR